MSRPTGGGGLTPAETRSLVGSLVMLVAADVLPYTTTRDQAARLGVDERQFAEAVYAAARARKEPERSVLWLRQMVAVLNSDDGVLA